MNVIASWLGSKLATFSSATFDGIKNIWFFILNINAFITKFFTDLGAMIGYLIRSTFELNELISTFPSFLIVFATASVTILVAYKILGRS